MLLRALAGRHVRNALLILAAVVLAAVLAGSGRRRATPTAIPAVLHASWKDARLPPRFAAWRNASLLAARSFEHVLWTDADNRALVARAFPEHLALYDAFPKGVMRADFARLAYMHERGGAYADLDVEIVGNLGETLAVPGSSSRARLDALGSKACRPGRAYPRLVPDDKVGMLAGGSGCRRELVLASMGDPADVHWWPHALPNAFMASVPGHPFWAFAAGQVARLWREKREGAARELGVDLKEAEGRKEFAAKMEEGVEYVTGPGMLAHAVFDYVLVDPRRAEGIQLLGPEIVFGYDWQHRRDLDAVCSSQWSSFDREKCLDAVRAGTGTARAFKQPALLELRVVETGGLLDRKRQGVVVEVVEEGRSSIAGTVAVSYWSHSWGDNPAVLQGGG